MSTESPNNVAQVLTEALPYLQNLYGKTIVIKGDTFDQGAGTGPDGICGVEHPPPRCHSRGRSPGSVEVEDAPAFAGAGGREPHITSLADGDELTLESIGNLAAKRIVDVDDGGCDRILREQPAFGRPIALQGIHYLIHFILDGPHCMKGSSSRWIVSPQ